MARTDQAAGAPPSRRALITAAAVAPAWLAAGAASAADDPIADMVVVNTLGALFDINATVTPQQNERLLAVSMYSFPDAVSAQALADARAAGMTAVNITLGYVFGDVDPYEHTVAEMGRWRRILEAHPDEIVHVRASSDILRAKAEGKVGAILGFQNCAMLGESAERVDVFADLGARVFQLTYNGPNALGDGSLAPGNRGLSAFGRAALQRMNERRVISDLSHSGERLCLEAIAASHRPVTITHTGCRALNDTPRNKTDAELRGVAEGGGYVGIYFMPFLRAAGPARPEDVVAHIEHAIQVCGEDHVGIGTDGSASPIRDMRGYMERQNQWVAARARIGVSAPGEQGGTPFFVEGLNDTDQFRNLAIMLNRRGHSCARIEKILGLNFVRVARDIWGA